MNGRRRIGITLALTLLATMPLFWPQPAEAYVEAPYTLGRIITESTNVMLLRIEKVDKERNLIVYRKVKDLKGQHPTEVIKHNIGKGGFHPREWQITMEWADVGKTAVMFHNGGASETCIHNYWYQCYAGGEWWNMSHAEPYLLRSFSGNPDKLAPAVASILEGKEVPVPCMVDDPDKMKLQLRLCKVQRLKASLKIQDYNPQRDFAGMGGGDDFRALAGMPGFSHYAAINRVDPEALGIAPADFDSDGKMDLCLYGASKVVLLQNGGNSFNEVSLPYSGGARAAIWGDYNGDGKPDLFLATPSGPKLFTNMGGGTFKDDTGLLPHEPYYNLTAAAWIDYDGDGKPDLLLANGFLGLRLYRNKGPGAVVAPPVKLGKWHYCGPFSNTGQKGFDKLYPPEQEIDFNKKYPGKGGKEAVWKDGDFKDGEINSFLPLFEPKADVVVYVYREIEATMATDLPISLGSDDTLTVWFNGQKVLAENVYRACAPDQHQLTLKLKPGKNTMLMKICQGDGDWAYYFKANTPVGPLTPIFEDVSAQVGLGPDGIAGNIKGDYLAVADVNGDGRPDFLFSAGNGVLVLNTPKGFVEAKDSGIRYQAGKVVPIFGDYDGDKHPDLFVPQNGVCKLFKNMGNGKFQDMTAQAGDLAKPIPGANCAIFAPFSNKGRLDLFVGCLRGPNRYFRNQGNGTFVEATEQLGLDQRIFNTRGICVADLNKDGAPDIVFNNEGQDSAVLLGNPQRVAQLPPAPSKTQ
jgi:hypothetical protein